MREIKFRAWDGQVGRMTKTGIQFNNTTMTLDTIHRVILMQYTGLKDKNGVEIYEGDIVACKEYPENKEVIGDIRYIFITNEPLYDQKTYGGDYIVEVIGNIYENPELLEDTNETHA